MRRIYLPSKQNLLNLDNKRKLYMETTFLSMKKGRPQF